jgi:hypothetical protein
MTLLLVNSPIFPVQSGIAFAQTDCLTERKKAKMVKVVQSGAKDEVPFVRGAGGSKIGCVINW